MQTLSDDSNMHTRPKPIMWVFGIGAIALIVLTFCCCGGGLFVFKQLNPFPSADIKHTDFNTNQERLDFANQLLPIRLPPSTSITRFQVTGFQDYHMDFEGTIPQAEIDPFIQSLPPLDETSPGQFEGRVGSDHIEITIDRSTGTILIEWFET